MLTTARRRTPAGTWPLVGLLAALAVAAVLLGTVVGAAGTWSTVGVSLGVARLAVDGLGTATIGLTLFPLLVTGAERAGRDDHARARVRAGRFAVVAAAGWAVAALLALWLRAAEAAGVPPFSVRPGALADYATAVADGRGLLLTLACALLVAVLALTAGRSPGRRLPGTGVLSGSERLSEVAIGAAVLGVLPGPVTGHASGHLDRGAAVVFIALHVIAAAVWVGGLFAVASVSAGRPAVLLAALSRFAAVVGYCAGVVAVTGVLSAASRLPGPGALVGTGYGALVVAKATGLLVVLGLAWRQRRRLFGRPGGAGARRWLTFELAVLAAVFGLAAALAGSAPT